MPDPSPTHLLNQTLAGKYRLREVISSGGFGTVFRAEQFFCDGSGEVGLEAFDQTGTRIPVANARDVKRDAGDNSSS